MISEVPQTKTDTAKCPVCRDQFTLIVEVQTCCSATCVKAVKRLEEYWKVRAELDRLLLRSMLNEG